jgi:hypothetical protein
LFFLNLSSSSFIIRVRGLVNVSRRSIDARRTMDGAFT